MTIPNSRMFEILMLQIPLVLDIETKHRVHLCLGNIFQRCQFLT